MQPTCIAYATQPFAYATQLLHMQPRLLHMQPSFCICNPAIAYATHTQKLENFFYTLEEQGPMKLMLSNLYNASMVAPVALDRYGSGN